MIADRMQLIKPSATIAISMMAAEMKAAGKDVIGLGFGEADFDTPEHIKYAGVQAIVDNQTRYTAVAGTPALKEAIMGKFSSENRLNYEANEVMASTGLKQVIFNAFMATLNAGYEVIIPAPYWVSYPDMVTLTGGKPVIVDCSVNNGFKITPQQLEASITPKTKWLILNSPSNPTGMVYTRGELEALAKVLLKHPQVYVMSDDVYEHLIYTGKSFWTLAEVEPKLASRVLTCNGVSKGHRMTGWRIGFCGIKNAELISAMTMVQSQSTSSPCAISQAAATAALNGPNAFMEEANEAFKERRDFCVEALNDIDGISCANPDGAFYVFPSVQGLYSTTTPGGVQISSDLQFANYLLEEHLVAVIPGVEFGGEGYFRISYSTDMETLGKAMDRINTAVESLA